MSEVTRVPIKPISKGSLLKLWLGVALALLVAAGAAYAARSRGVEIETLRAGTGPSPAAEDMVLVNYEGRLASSGKVFDKGERVPFLVEGVVPGFAEGLQKMKVGGKYRLFIPSDKAYGDQDQPNPATGEIVIPANSDLMFDIELLDMRTRAEVEAQRRMLQQMQQMQGPPPGGPGMPPPGAPPAP